MFYVLIIVLVFIDFITKYLAHYYLAGGKIFHVIGDFFYIQYVQNVGIAFSLPVTGLLLKILTFVLLGVILYYYVTEEKKKKNTLVDIAFAFVFAGGLGNGYERIVNGYVIDFLGVKYFSVFNFADICISIGVVLYIWYLLHKKNLKNMH